MSMFFLAQFSSPHRAKFRAMALYKFILVLISSSGASQMKRRASMAFVALMMRLLISKLSFRVKWIIEPK